jgi:hypothetical protein
LQSKPAALTCRGNERCTFLHPAEKLQSNFLRIRVLRNTGALNMYKRIIPVALAALAGSQAALASTYDEGQWVTTFIGGASLIPHGTLQSGATGDISNLGTIDATRAGESATTAIDRLSFRDAFRVGPTFGFETGYMADSNVEPFVRLQYSQLNGRNDRIGELTSPGLATPAGVTANFDDTKSWSLNVGTRYFLADAGAIRPFVAGYIGANRTDALRAHFAVDGLADLGNEVLLPRETRFDGGVEGGVNFQLGDQADLRLSVGANYVAARHERTDALAPLGVDSLQVTDQRWTIPIDLGLNYRF